MYRLIFTHSDEEEVQFVNLEKAKTAACEYYEPSVIKSEKGVLMYFFISEIGLIPVH